MDCPESVVNRIHGKVGKIVSKKLPHTPSSRIRSALRQLWLRSRERAAALKRDKYSCVKCGVKQSKAKGKEVKVEVHHKNPIEDSWNFIIEDIAEYILGDVDNLEVLCKECHLKTHKK